MSESSKLYGLMAEFLTPEGILDATRRARRAGYRDLDAYTPYPVHGLATELGMRGSRVPSIVLVGGLVGAAVGYFMQDFALSINYPINVGGKPLNSWPMFIPITFELLILVASFAALFAFMFLNGLPQPHHPVFNAPQFVRASQDRLFLCNEASDPQFDADATAAFLATLEPHGPLIEIPYDESENPESEAPITAVGRHETTPPQR
jgi:hypothetical protein